MTQRDHDILRVSKSQLMRIFGRSLARPLLERHIRELEAAPEGDVMDAPISDEARTLARMDIEKKRRRA